MTTEEIKSRVAQYIDKARWGVLATVREDRAPASRIMGSFASDGIDLYFSTRVGAEKVEHIKHNNKVSFCFQHDDLEAHPFRSVSLVGVAQRVTGAELARGIVLLGARNSRFKARVEKGGLPDIAVYRITTKELKFLDASKNPEHNAVIELHF